MSTSLIAEAENAQDIAEAFTRFLDPARGWAAEITGLIAELYAISSALRDLNSTAAEPRYYRDYNLIREDVRLILYSLNYTFEDVFRLLGRLDRLSYGQVWLEIMEFFQLESGNTLCRRLELYKIFLQDLSRVLEGVPTDVRTLDELQLRIDILLEKQEVRHEDSFRRMSLGPQRSFERRRPTHCPPESPSRSYVRRRPPHRPMASDGFFEEDYIPPRAPEPPGSPTATTFSHSSTNSSAIIHWAPALFEQPPSITQFVTTGQASKCVGPDLPGASARLSQEYDRLLDLPFENGDLIVRLYIRQSDFRARIHCRLLRPSQLRKECCLPLISLQAVRSKSSLQLCRSSRSGRSLELWACLRFPSYERMILFYCTFLALKAQDPSSLGREMDNHELRGETEEFGGKIVDDHYHHALRIYKDQDSGGIRLQASVYSGELKGTPVWTAFITHQIRSTRWMRRAGQWTIQLADLHRYIFTTEYAPQLGPEGQHELSFIRSTDAKDFYETILLLAKER